LAPDAALGAPPAGWTAVAASPAAALVGLSGVGKTTLARGLAALGFAPLPDRRRLVDLVVLPAVAGEDATLDREGRFAATARFREAAPGGVATVLAALAHPSDGRRRIFDGLRGAAEVEAFAEAAPAARFVALEADDDVRAARIAGRAEAFDGAEGADAAAARARAERIVAEEAAHYDAGAARAALVACAPGRTLFVDAAAATAEEALAAAAAFLGDPAA
ncbi:MAG: AAA family ATPase, partial [Pseudomonadota bacterium]